MAVRAFVSFVRFYYKHECQLIFRPKCKGKLYGFLCLQAFLYLCSSLLCHMSIHTVLDLPRLASGTYALLQLPRMPELKHIDTSAFEPHSVTLDQVPYKDISSQEQAIARKKAKGRGSAFKRNTSLFHCSRTFKNLKVGGEAFCVLYFNLHH